jgi:asparagine synthetase B (glutamine-hydrolysing)
VIDSPDFEYEIGYAKQAAERFNTNHHFVKISEQQFTDYIIETIDVLGRPISFDGTAYFWGLVKYLSANENRIKFLFDGTLADGLLGSPRSIWIVQGDKYRNWPIPALDLLGYILKPFSQSKAFGAYSAAKTLRDQKNLDSPDCYLNNGDMGTNWDIVSNSFPPQVLSDALAVNRNIEKRYLSSEFFVEQLNVIGLLTGSIEHTLLLRQLGLYKGVEFIFPYSDEVIVEAAFSFLPLERYTYQNFPKPILRFALESRAQLEVINQRKGQSSLMRENVFPWMRHGALRDLVRSIERPQFLSTSDFEHSINNPDWFTWNMLTMDLYLKNVLGEKI